MIADPNVLLLGGLEDNDRAALFFADGDVPASVHPEDIDVHDDLDFLWRLEPSGDDFVFHNESEGDEFATYRSDGTAHFHGDMRVTGQFRDLHLASETTRLDGFSGGIHELRYTSTDADRIAEIERGGSNDYHLRVYRDGDPLEVLLEGDDFEVGDLTAETITVDGDSVITDADQQFPHIENDGSLVAEEPDTIDFGTDLGVTETADGVEVEYVGATIPALVYDDGVEVFADANGIDFIDPLYVEAGADDIAEVNLDLPDDIASTTEAETITAEWTFSQTIDGTADHALSADVASTASGLSSSLWDDIAQLGEAEEIPSDWRFTGDPTLGGGGRLIVENAGTGEDWVVRHSDALDALIFSYDGTSQFRLVDGDTPNFPNGVRSGGDAVATEAYADAAGFNEAENYSPTGNWTFGGETQFDGEVTLEAELTSWQQMNASGGLTASNLEVTGPADFSDTPYVVLPVRDSEPTDPPEGATFITLYD